MRPRKDDEALVDVLDVLLRDGAVLRADVIVSVADIPLIGIKLTAAIAGMETMQEYGLFEQWDIEHRRSAITRRGKRNPDQKEALGGEASTPGRRRIPKRNRTETKTASDEETRSDDG